MGELLRIMIPLTLFMLIPLWIPLLAVAIGGIADRVRPARITPAGASVSEAKARAAALKSGARHGQGRHVSSEVATA